MAYARRAMTATTLAPGLEHGVYSYGEAAAVVGVSTQRLRRWADGYTYARKYDLGIKEAVLQTERRQGVLNFYELIELFFVREYVNLSVPLDDVRRAAKRLAEEVGPYPFASADLVVAGRELLRKGDGDLVNPASQQVVFAYAQDLSEDLTFLKRLAKRYAPPEYHGRLYLDAGISGGQPVVSEFAVPTRSVYGLWKVEGDVELVADHYDISSEEVSAAVRFEAECRKAA